MRAVWLSALSLLFPTVLAASAFGQQQQNVPDAPAPQAQPSPNAPAPQSQPLPDLKGVPPGKGTTSDEDGAAAAGQPAVNGPVATTTGSPSRGFWL